MKYFLFPVTRLGDLICNLFVNNTRPQMPDLVISPNFYLVKLRIRKEKFEKNEKKDE